MERMKCSRLLVSLCLLVTVQFFHRSEAVYDKDEDPFDPYAPHKHDTPDLPLPPYPDYPRPDVPPECRVSQSDAEIEEALRVCLVEIEPANIAQANEEEIAIASDVIPSEVREPGKTAQRFLGNSPEAFEQRNAAELVVNCLEYLAEQFNLSKCQSENLINILQNNEFRIEEFLEESVAFSDSDNATAFAAASLTPLQQFILQFWTVGPSCPYTCRNGISCATKTTYYRTIDGSCNNVLCPAYGMAARPLARLLPPDYGNGISSPRLGKGNVPLPNARDVSIGIHTKPTTPTPPIPEHFLTLLHMSVGQIIDHDLDRTAISVLATGAHVECGFDECQTVGTGNNNCLPIDIFGSDPDFTDPCLKFVRSQGALACNCPPGPREQLNQITSFLDLSMVYGNSDADHVHVRDQINPITRGKLQLVDNPLPHGSGLNKVKPLLPPTPVNLQECRGTLPLENCFVAGDERVNDQIGLMNMHTMLQRAHNKIEQKLYDLNGLKPGWDGEKLFDETRKLLGAIWQNIVYKEYLPPLLGLDTMERYKLNILKSHPKNWPTSYYTGYDGMQKPEISNVFATSAYRLGHSQIHEMFRLSNPGCAIDEDLVFSTIINDPTRMYKNDKPIVAATPISGPDAITLGQTCQRSEVVDRFFSRSIQRNLFSNFPQMDIPGTDLAALDIQRARDHGLPGYNAWRAYCGLSVANSFANMVDIDPTAQAEFANLYGHVDDVDLFPAAMAEKHVPLGIVGPTFACLLGKEFHKIRSSDRFWFERAGVTGFSPAQLAEIRKATLAWLFCENGDDIQMIQKYVLMIPYSEALANPGLSGFADYVQLRKLYLSDNNDRRPCAQLPQPNLDLWNC